MRLNETCEDRARRGMVLSPYATKFTRTWLEHGKKRAERNATNGKPYRTKRQREIARETAWQGKDGVWRSDAPLSFHPPARSNAA